MLVGHRQGGVSMAQRLTARQVVVSLVCALFHDAGYIRKRADRRTPHGALYPPVHVRRSGSFINTYLVGHGMLAWAPAARRIIGYTAHSYVDCRAGDDWIETSGAMLASADLLAQLADPWYLEKCRYRLHPEFVIAGLVVPAGSCESSAQEFLRQTPVFMRTARQALDGPLAGVHRSLETFYRGGNPYLDALSANLERLEGMISRDDFTALRPPPNWPFSTPSAGRPLATPQ